MPMKSWLDETQKEKGEKEEKGIKTESGGGREMKGQGDKKGGISPLRSLWQESARISRDLVANQILHPAGGGSGGGHQADAALKPPLIPTPRI